MAETYESTYTTVDLVGGPKETSTAGYLADFFEFIRVSSPFKLCRNKLVMMLNKFLLSLFYVTWDFYFGCS